MDLEGKIIIITGSTTGLGLHCAKALLVRGATVVLTCRDLARGKAAVEKVQEEANGREGFVHLFELDLANYCSILRFCREVTASFEKIDVLVCNAGVMGLPFELSSNNIEMHFAVNYWGHFVLVEQLLPLLEKAEDGRVVSVSSGLYKGASALPDVKQLMGESTWDYSARPAYAISKLACCVWITELARRLSARGSRVMAVGLRPGFVRGTELGRETHWLLRALAAPLIWMVAKGLDEGIVPMVHCASVSRDQLHAGAMYSGIATEEYSEAVTAELGKHLWAMSEEIEKVVVNRCTHLDETDKQQYENRTVL